MAIQDKDDGTIIVLWLTQAKGNQATARRAVELDPRQYAVSYVLYTSSVHNYLSASSDSRTFTAEEEK